MSLSLRLTHALFACQVSFLQIFIQTPSLPTYTTGRGKFKIREIAENETEYIIFDPHFAIEMWANDIPIVWSVSKVPTGPMALPYTAKASEHLMTPLQQPPISYVPYSVRQTRRQSRRTRTQRSTHQRH